MRPCHTSECYHLSEEIPCALWPKIQARQSQGYETTQIANDRSMGVMEYLPLNTLLYICLYRSVQTQKDL